MVTFSINTLSNTVVSYALERFLFFRVFQGDKSGSKARCAGARRPEQNAVRGIIQDALELALEHVAGHGFNLLGGGHAQHARLVHMPNGVGG